MSKAREWWIDIRDGFTEIHFWDGNFNGDEAANCIHVIEKSAFDDLQVKHDALKSLLAEKDLELDHERTRSAKLVEALKEMRGHMCDANVHEPCSQMWYQDVIDEAIAAYSDKESAKENK